MSVLRQRNTTVKANSPVDALVAKIALNVSNKVLEMARSFYDPVSRAMKNENSLAVAAVCLQVACTKGGRADFYEGLQMHSTLNKIQFKTAVLSAQPIVDKKPPKTLNQLCIKYGLVDANAQISKMVAKCIQKSPSMKQNQGLLNAAAVCAGCRALRIQIYPQELYLALSVKKNVFENSVVLVQDTCSKELEELRLLYLKPGPRKRPKADAIDNNDYSEGSESDVRKPSSRSKKAKLDEENDQRDSLSEDEMGSNREEGSEVEADGEGDIERELQAGEQTAQNQPKSVKTSRKQADAPNTSAMSTPSRCTNSKSKEEITPSSRRSTRLASTATKSNLPVKRPNNPLASASKKPTINDTPLGKFFATKRKNTSPPETPDGVYRSTRLSLARAAESSPPPVQARRKAEIKVKKAVTQNKDRKRNDSDDDGEADEEEEGDEERTSTRQNRSAPTKRIAKSKKSKKTQFEDLENDEERDLLEKEEEMKAAKQRDLLAAIGQPSMVWAYGDVSNNQDRQDRYAIWKDDFVRSLKKKLKGKERATEESLDNLFSNLRKQMAEVHFIGTIQGASGFPGAELCAKWSILAGDGWTLVEGDTGGQTQVDIPEVGLPDMEKVI
ncbi:B9 domain-containing protein 2 [Phlyctochytrium planicorne]|nr:B9 domain-containing protein 2 [Phlyctochytrium planicorne]